MDSRLVGSFFKAANPDAIESPANPSDAKIDIIKPVTCLKRPTTMQSDPAATLKIWREPAIPAIVATTNLVEADFDSESDEKIDPRLLPLRNNDIIFLDEIKAGQMLKGISESKFLNFGDLVKENEKRYSAKFFKCDHCSKTFQSPQSKGGHISKIHKNKSVKYIKRTISSRMRAPERERIQFLKKLSFSEAPRS